jgi:D-galactose 1-dehydrogenase
MTPIKVAIVGLGKIARDQHVPSLAANGEFELAAVASPRSTLAGVPNFRDLPALLQGVPEVSAIVLCTPPQVRYEMAYEALRQGRHVLLEKPPGVTVSEVLALAELADQKGVTLFASWHSRHAAAVEAARAWLAPRTILGATIAWKEDVRVWHPGQTWIWRAGGLGVFDPGINALSILTRIMPGTLFLQDARLAYPSNCEAPIAAQLSLVGPQGARLNATFDFLQTGPQTWDIEVDTDAGRLTLSMGGTQMRVDGRRVQVANIPEYATLYAHFAQLVRTQRSDVDVRPLQLVADAFLCARCEEAAEFVE